MFVSFTKNPIRAIHMAYVFSKSLFLILDQILNLERCLGSV